VGFPRAAISPALSQGGVAVSHPAACRQIADLAGIDRRLGAEVKAFEIAHGREVGDLGGHLDPPLLLPDDLALAEEGDRLA
jgi:hypothetical protein